MGQSGVLLGADRAPCSAQAEQYCVRVSGPGGLCFACIPALSSGIEHAFITRFQVNEFSNQVALLDQFQRTFKKLRFAVRWVEKGDIEALLGVTEKAQCVRLCVLGSCAAYQIVGILLYGAQRTRIRLDEMTTGGPLRKRFKTQHTGPGKQIQAMSAGDVRAQPVKQGFADAPDGGAQSLIAGKAELSSFPFTTDNAHFLGGVGGHLRPIKLQ